jgi:RhtB (resistance to homoserine/threonine) family protein
MPCFLKTKKGMIVIMYFEVFTVGVLAAISPGPDFLVVTKNSLNNGPRVGVATALGISVALVFHITYTVIGFDLIQNNYLIFKTIQILGSMYLIWIGLQLIKTSSGNDAGNIKKIDTNINFKNLLEGFKEGFMCNLLNPKAVLFFMSIFSQFLSINTTYVMKWILGLEIILTVGVWFIILSIFISSHKFRGIYLKYQYLFNRILGLILFYFAIKIILTVTNL